MTRLLVLLFLTLLVAPEALAKRVALVIGNGNYQHTTQLRQAPRDAKLVADTLRSLEFDEVTLIRDTGRAEMLRALIAFQKGTRDAEVSFVYYAGHGIQVGGVNYLVPVDARLESPEFAPVEAVSAQEILNEMARAHSLLNVVVLDACRNNPFTRSWAGSTKAFGARGLEPMQAPSGTDFLLAFATAPDSAAPDDGSYARSLVKHLREDCMSLPEVFGAVKEDLEGDRTPWVSAAYGRSAFRLFAGGCDTTSAPPPRPRPAPKPPTEPEPRPEPGPRPVPVVAPPPAPEPPCGNAREDAGEQCDFGAAHNTGAPGGCTADCRLVWATVPAGTYTIGSPKSERGDDDEGRPREVTFTRSYRMLATEVTKAQQRRFGAPAEGDDEPWRNVSWTDARAWCHDVGAELPTEVEWEVAARGGTTTPWSCGNDPGCLDAVAWHGGNSGGRVHAVATRKKNAFGLYDMHGNVWEWVEDRYDAAAWPKVTDATAVVTQATGSYRGDRGGSYLNGPGLLRSAYRGWYGPADRGEFLGFRCVSGSRRQR